MLFIFRDLGLEYDDEEEEAAAEELVMEYIRFLREAGKLSIIPLYASRLSSDSRLDILGETLLDEPSASERRFLTQLMESYNINIAEVIRRQIIRLTKQLDDMPREPREDWVRSGILKKAEPAPAIRTLQENFLGADISPENQSLIRSFLWFLDLKGHWKATFTLGAYIYRRFFRMSSLPPPVDSPSRNITDELAL
jgi:nuclear pore complex protein Nup107